ncbi:MAG: FG-GAP repeat domain-containing protein [Pyrinomonadaceae bacterium]
MSFSNRFISKFIRLGLVVLSFATIISAQAIIRTAAGANPAAIQNAVDQFRNDLGALNPNNGNSFKSGRREINWDGVGDGAASPNKLLPDFFNFNSPRGVMFSSTAGPFVQGNIAQPFEISSTVASGVPVRFGNINPTYTNEFKAFSEQRIFTTTPESNVIEITFFIPRTNIPATVSGFGAVLTDVDTPATHMQFYDQTGRILLTPSGGFPTADKGLSFQGVSFNDGTRISRVVIVLGNAPLNAGNTDGLGDLIDVVAMDDFIYSEPRVLEHHPADFDGDGTADLSVYRPGAGQSQWFIINSGSNTIDVRDFGVTGDIPIDGDFDGDRLSDFTVFRPTTGEWFRLNSSNGAFSIQGWGLNGDKPVAADYDKDGKTDLAVWRPTDGNYYIIRSSNGTILQTGWGLPGDIPIARSGQ